MGDIEAARKKAIEQKRLKRCTGYVDSDDPRLQHPSYKQSREMWGRFIRGEITSKELDEAFRDEPIEVNREENIGDLYGEDGSGLE
jgi:hypothetical protein